MSESDPAPSQWPTPNCRLKNRVSQGFQASLSDWGCAYIVGCGESDAHIQDVTMDSNQALPIFLPQFVPRSPRIIVGVSKDKKGLAMGQELPRCGPESEFDALASEDFEPFKL